MRKKVSVISLGCDKNRVDTERMLYNLNKSGLQIIDEKADAEIIIINTCAFIESARAEAIDTILEAAEYKKDKLEKLIVTGCLPQKYLDDIKEEIPEADAFLGTQNYEKIAEVIDELYKGNRVCGIEKADNPDFAKRIQTTPSHYAYLKIADGCNNFCTFCTIPSIRGKYVSRDLDSLLREAENLASNGVSELILVAQDVTSYGIDLYGKFMLVPLLKKLSLLDFTWIRLMYCYPELVSDELLNEIDENPKIVKYIDIPLQHTDDKILKKMNRRSNRKDIEILLGKINGKKNRIALRTTFMVGFPSETEKEFNNLYNFLKKHKIDNVGIFAYSKEEDTPSAKIQGEVEEKTKIKRLNKLGRQHYKNAKKNNKAMIGKTVKVLYEGIDYQRNLFKGRTEYNAPEIDSEVYFKGEFADIGHYYNVKITGCDGYDLIGEITE